MGVTKQQIVDKDKALDYCNDFYDRQKLGLEAMAFGAQTAAQTFTSVFTERAQKSFLTTVAEGAFLLALNATPGGLVLTATWKTLMMGKSVEYANRAAWLLSQVPAAAQTAAKSADAIKEEKKSFETRTKLLRATLVKIGKNLFKQMEALIDERDRARQTIYNVFLNNYDDGRKCWASLEAFAKELLGKQPKWDSSLLGDVTKRFEKQLFKTYVERKVTISNPMPLVYELYDGLNDDQFDHIKASFKEISKVQDLRFKWKAKLKPRVYQRSYGW